MLGQRRKLLIVYRDPPAIDFPPVAAIVHPRKPGTRLLAALDECWTAEADVSCLPTVAVRARLQQINRIVKEAQK